MKYLNKPIAYLQDNDFDVQGNLINQDIPKNIPVIIMIQAAFCGYCTQAKPSFQTFADKNQGTVFCATIQGDGDQPGEKKLGSRVKKFVPNFRGYPHYVKYIGGKQIKKSINGRNIADLQEFAKN
jgi:thiol-disulfide isomerase/thioredoxin